MHAGVDRRSHWGRLERQVYEVKAWRLLMSAELRKEGFGGRVYLVFGATRVGGWLPSRAVETDPFGTPRRSQGGG